MASSIGFRMLSFLPSCYSSYGAWTLTPVGLAPTDHASLRWTHRFPLPNPIVNASSGFNESIGQLAKRDARVLGNRRRNRRDQAELAVAAEAGVRAIPPLPR